MNTLNFTFNFNAPVGQNIAHVDRLEAHFDKDMQAVGYKEKTKYLTRSQVKVIVKFLGEP